MTRSPADLRAATLRSGAQTASGHLPALILSAERLAAMIAPGAHGLRRSGPGEDFWQYRPAVAGDPAGLIDWRRSARSDAAFVRERERQAPQSAALWVSGAAGMGWTGDPARPTKGDRARLLALARVSTSSSALVSTRSGVSVTATPLSLRSTPSPGPSGVSRLPSTAR